MNLTPRRMLVINLNSNHAVTRKIREVVSAVGVAGYHVEATQPAGAPHAIVTPENRRAVKDDNIAITVNA